MSVNNIIDILFQHLEMNELVTNGDIQLITKNYPEVIYEGTVYRCIIGDRVIKTDLWQSWTKDKAMAYTIVSNIRGGYNQGKRILLEQQVTNGIDIIKLLRILKYKENFNKKEYDVVCKLLSSYKQEQEVLCRLNDTYKILEIRK